MSRPFIVGLSGAMWQTVWPTVVMASTGWWFSEECDAQVLEKWSARRKIVACPTTPRNAQDARSCAESWLAWTMGLFSGNPIGARPNRRIKPDSSILEGFPYLSAAWACARKGSTGSGFFAGKKQDSILFCHQSHHRYPMHQPVDIFTFHLSSPPYLTLRRSISMRPTSGRLAINAT